MVQLSPGLQRSFAVSLAPLLLAAGVLGLGSESQAAIQKFRGRAPISYGSSIPGIARQDVFYFDLSIDDSINDVENFVEVNSFGGVTALGEFRNAIVGFQLFADPANLGSLDPAGITFRPGRIDTIDAGPGVSNPNYLEKLMLSLPVTQASIDAGAPFSRININLYNGTLYDNPSTRQLLLDESAGLPISFADLFLHGPQTIEEFRGQRDIEVEALVDSIFIEGLFGSGQLASGQGVTLQAVRAPAPLPLLGALCGWRASRRLRARQRISG